MNPKVGETWECKLHDGWYRGVVERAITMESYEGDITNYFVTAFWYMVDPRGSRGFYHEVRNSFCFNATNAQTHWRRVSRIEAVPDAEANRVLNGHLTAMSDEVSAPKVGETWEYRFDGKVWKCTFTKVIPERPGSDILWCSGLWYRDGEPYEHDREKRAFYRPKEASMWTRIDAPGYDKPGSFGDLVSKALQNDAWSSIDGRFKKR
jgi:hypothetical protein